MSRILIGTPIHSSKDYAVKQWIEAVEKLDYQVEELFLVDNSKGLEYMEYLKTIFPKNIKTTITHIDIGDQYEDAEQRVSFAREEIRKKVIDEGFDWWFSWECDTIAPPNVLTEMMKYSDENKMIQLMSPSRNDPDANYENSFGLTLVHRDLLVKFGFLLQWGKIDSLMPNCWHGTDAWFARRVMRELDGKFIELYGHVKPLYHLKEQESVFLQK